MKTRVAVYEEGLFDLRGSNLFKGGEGANAPQTLHRKNGSQCTCM